MVTDIIDRLRDEYPNVRFGIISTKPMVILYDDLKLVNDNAFTHFCFDILHTHLTTAEMLEALVLYDTLGELNK